MVACSVEDLLFVESFAAREKPSKLRQCSYWCWKVIGHEETECTEVSDTILRIT